MSETDGIVIPRVDVVRPQPPSDERRAGLRPGASRRNPEFAEMMKAAMPYMPDSSPLGASRERADAEYRAAVRQAEVGAVTKILVGTGPDDPGVMQKMAATKEGLRLRAQELVNSGQIDVATFDSIMAGMSNVFTEHPDSLSTSIDYEDSGGVRRTIDGRYDMESGDGQPRLKALTLRLSESKGEVGGSAGVNIPIGVDKNGALFTDATGARLVNPEGTMSALSFSQVVDQMVGTSNVAAGVFERRANRASAQLRDYENRQQ